MIVNPLEIDIINHIVPGLSGPQDIEGLKMLLGPLDFKRDDGITERWFFPQALVDVDKNTSSIQLIDFTREAPIRVLGKDPFRDPTVLTSLCQISKDWEQHRPLGDHYFYDLKLALYYNLDGDLSESTFAFFWSNMPPKREIKISLG